ncbi:MAG: hypothetical protein ACI9TH_003900 [Kiritimatiellia bacterium]|jgi:hypothetical protein
MQEVAKKSDLIVVAKLEKQQILESCEVAGNPAQLCVTTFTQIITHKGDEPAGQLSLRHLQWDYNALDKRGNFSLANNQASLPDLDPLGSKEYLLYLRRNSDGAYELMGKQTHCGHAARGLQTDSHQNWGGLSSERLKRARAEHLETFRKKQELEKTKDEPLKPKD